MLAHPTASRKDKKLNTMQSRRSNDHERTIVAGWVSWACLPTQLLISSLIATTHCLWTTDACFRWVDGWMDGWKTKKRTNAQSRRMVLVFFALETRVPWRQNNRLAVGSLGSGLGLVQHAGRIEPWIWVTEANGNIPFHMSYYECLFHSIRLGLFVTLPFDRTLALECFPTITSKLYRHTVKFGVPRSKLQTEPQVWGLAHRPATWALPRRSGLGRGERHCGRVFWIPQVPDTDLEFWEQWSALQIIITFRWAADLGLQILGKQCCLQGMPTQDISQIHFITPVEASSTE